MLAGLIPTPSLTNIFISGTERPNQHNLRLVLHRRLDRSWSGSHRLNPLQPGGRLHQDRQGAGGRHEHAVPHAGLPPEAAVPLRPLRLCRLPRTLLREPVRTLQLLKAIKKHCPD